ncbi:MAG: hypothetical protein KA444_06430 [Bacteroidia bacterium]|nr:hypothetical protein [Bacteroidia bacterium]
MKNLYALLIVFFIATSSSFAQRTADVALSGGVTNYIGDLGNENLFPFSSANFGSALTIRNFLNNPRRSGTYQKPFDMQVRFSWHRLQYEETNSIGSKDGTELRNYLRGIGFRNDLFGTEVGLTYNFLLNRRAPLTKPKFSGFLMVGVGVFYGQPKADLFNGDVAIENRYHFWQDGTVRDRPENEKQIGIEVERDGKYETNLNQWMTEGQGYNREIHSQKPYDFCNVGIPMGAGIRYLYNKYLTLSLEFNYYYFFTDYLDDVSTRYATYEELLASFPDLATFEIAKYISDPTGKGTNGYVGPVTSPRGNPDLSDSFTYLSFEASYKIKWQKKKVYGQ